MPGSTATATQPSAMYSGADTQRGAFGQTSFKATPASAPLHTTARIVVAAPGDSRSTAKGVYVPAMNTKIIEWSSRRMIGYIRRDQTRRWYSALVPNSRHTVVL